MASIGTVTLPFNWAVVNQTITWKNLTKYQLRLTGGVTITNGVTAGSGGSEGVTKFNTSNTEYVMTQPSTEMAAGATLTEPFIGVEILDPNDEVTLKVTTCPSGATGGYATFTWMQGD